MTMEKDSWSHNPVKEASNLASDSITPCAHSLKSYKRNSNSRDFCGLDVSLDYKTSIADSNYFDYPKCDINRTCNDIDYFENAENKYSSDLLYCDWPEIENFEDIDRMLRSCDSPFGLGVCKEDELGCLPSDDTGGSGNVLKLDVNFPYPEPIELGNISEKDDFLNGYSINESPMISPPIRYKDSSWTSNKSDSYRSSITVPDIADSKDHFNLQKQSNEHKSQINQETQTEGKSKEQYVQNYRFSHATDLLNESGELSSGLTPCQNPQSVYMQQQQRQPALASYLYTYSQYPTMHSDISQLSDPSSVHLKPFVAKSETNDITSVSPRDSSYAPTQLQYTEGTSDSGFEATALAICGQRKKLHCNQEPTELASSNIQESLTMGSDLDDISLDAATFQQLQLVKDKLDSRTKLCIRDSLYRLAQSAEQRHDRANLNAGCGREDTGTKRFTSFMDMETDTNPIDRSVAQLLFHRPSDSFPLKSSSVDQTHVASPPILGVTLGSEENDSEVQKVLEC